MGLAYISEFSCVELLILKEGCFKTKVMAEMYAGGRSPGSCRGKDFIYSGA
jgi:hypothetical protein